MRNSANITPLEGKAIAKTPNVGASGLKHTTLMQFLQPRNSTDSAREIPKQN